jgi:hypothetical protein
LTAEVPDDDTGCRIMNPEPVRLPFDIEVCGLEIVETKHKGPMDFAFIAGVSADLKWTNEELLEMFEIINSV